MAALRPRCRHADRRQWVAMDSFASRPTAAIPLLRLMAAKRTFEVPSEPALMTVEASNRADVAQAGTFQMLELRLQ